MENVQLGLVIVGMVNGVRMLFDESDPKHKGFIFFCVALVTGIVLGALHFFGATIELGLLAAVGSSGAYQIAKKVGGQ